MARIFEFPDLLELVAPEKIDVLGIDSEKQSNVSLPIDRVIGSQNGNATVSRFLERLPPGEPRAS